MKPATRSQNRPYIVIVLLTILALSIVVFIWRQQASEPGDKAEARLRLIAHYNPGSCYGMPGVNVDGNNKEINNAEIELKPSKGGWKYTVSDGKCCDITDYEGTISTTYAIIQTGKREETVPC